MAVSYRPRAYRKILARGGYSDIVALGFLSPAHHYGGSSEATFCPEGVTVRISLVRRSIAVFTHRVDFVLKTIHSAHKGLVKLITKTGACNIVALFDDLEKRSSRFKNRETKK